ncbi:type II toxin-antitoxin system RnlB family antitoxin [Bacteroides faecis]|uniref:type II toxin-antitoxin system RnlB family antitoxin n=1 Tax=Bacteroides faecis TaxID=674529 RepID=UPI0032F04A5F
MENKEFQIIPLQGRSLLVVILSSEMTNYYWKELQTELANLNIADAEVYFDFLYRNGLKNRFFKSKLKGMMLISNSLRKCEAPKEYIKVADTFLLHILNGLTVVYCLLSKKSFIKRELLTLSHCQRHCNVCQLHIIQQRCIIDAPLLFCTSNLGNGIT